MGNISTILAAILCAGAPLVSGEIQEPKKEVTQSNFQLGSDIVSQVRSSYEKGEYSEFLSEMDASFSGADLSGLIQMRQKQIPIEFQEEWERQFLELQKEKSSELLSAVSDNDDSMFAEKVRSLAANLLSPEQEKALSKLNSFISMAPGTGANADENALIDIDLEYEYKLLHAELPASDISPQERKALALALRMEKMDQMVEAAKSFQDHSLKEAVSIAAASFDARLARNLDGADLNAWAKGKAKPSSGTEETIYSILSLYQGKFSDLMKEIDHANQ